MQKRMLAMLLALAMLLGLAAVPATAAGLEVSTGRVALVEAEAYASHDGQINVIKDNTAANCSGKAYVGDFFQNYSLTYHVTAQEAGTYYVLLCGATQNDGCSGALSVDEGEAQAFAVANTGGWSNYQFIAIPVALSEGDHTLKVVNTSSVSGADGAWNLDYIAVAGSDAALTADNSLRYEAENAKTDGKVLKDGAASGGKYIGDFYAGKYVEFDLYVGQSGYYRMALGVADNQDGGEAAFFIDGVSYATRAFPTTKGWQSYVSLGVAAKLSAGRHTVRVVNNKNTWNVDYLDVSWITPQDGHAVRKDTPVTIAATNWENASGIFNETANVGGTDFTEWFDYTLDVAESGIYEISMEVACGNEVGAPDGVRVASSTGGSTVASVPITEGWQEYKTVTAELRLTAGVQKLTFTADYEGWNLKEFTITYLREVTSITYDGLAFDQANTQDCGSLIDGEKGETSIWKPTAENTYGGVRFRQPYQLSKAVVYGENVTGSLVFSDGTVVEDVTPTAEGVTVKLGTGDVYWVKFVAENPGEGAYLSELELQGEFQSGAPEDLALNAYLTGTTGGFRPMTELLGRVACTGNQMGLSFDETVEADSILFYGLPEALGDTFEGEIVLADGTSESFSVAISQDGLRKAILTPKSAKASELFTIRMVKDVELKFDAISLLGKTGVEVPMRYTDVQVKCRWGEQADKIFAVLEDGTLGYVSNQGDYDEAATRFDFIPVGDGTYYIENQGKRLVLAEDKVKAVDNGTDTWKLVPVSGNANMFSIVNSGNSACVLHMENNTGVIETSGAQSHWHSANWILTAQGSSYTISANRVDDNGYRAFSNDGTSITTNYGGSEQTWRLSTDISSKPTFTADNMPILEAVYNRTMEETFENTFKGTYGDVFNTGTNWNYVWTRDTAMSVQYSLAWIYPKVSENCALEKVLGLDTDHPVYQQDTGTGGSYPVSVDRIITALSIWEQYLTTGDPELLEKYYKYSENTIKQDLHVAYDPETGLFKGETGGLDHRDKTYPDWMSENNKDSLANIAESKSSIVNIIYCQVYEIMARSAELLNYGEDVVAKWETLKAELVKNVNEHFWDEERGLYVSWEYPNYMGAPKAYKYDVISNGYAVMYGIANEHQTQAIMENYPLVTYGADTVYPQKNGAQGGTIYHNRGVWPGWEATLMIGAGQEGNYQLAQEIWNSCLRGCAMTLTNYEVIDFNTGAGVASRNQLWSIAGTLSGYYRILFGMEYTEEGIVFRPFVDDNMEGPFELTNYPYRDATLTIRLTGKGDTLTSVKLDGVEMGVDYVLPTDLTDTHTLELVVTDSGKDSEINLSSYNHVTCPDMPEMTYKNGVFTWTEDARYTYRLWNGETWIDVSGGNYTPDPDVYGVYSLVAVDEDGIVSELSAPITIRPTTVVVEAESGEYTSQLYTGTAGYSDRGAVTSNARDAANSGVTVKVNIPQDGAYYLSVAYFNGGDSTSGNNCGIRSIYLDGEDVGTMLFPVMKSDHGYTRSTHMTLQLTEGKHTIRIAYATDNWYDENMNYLQGQQNQTIYLDYLQLDLAESAAEPEAPTVTAVTVEPATVTVTKGGTQQFTATVSGTGDYDDAVDWTVEGCKSDTTTISDTGLLTVAADETATTLTVKATSAVDESKSGTATVTVKAEEPGHTHSMSHVDAKAATCTVPGNIEYWHCEACDQYFSDYAATTAITQQQTVVNALGHDYATTWSSDKDDHYHLCSRCQAKADVTPHTWNVDAATEETDKHCTVCGYVAEPKLDHTHKGTLVPGTPATCTAPGVKSYYTCTCSKFFEDEACTKEITNLDQWKVIPQLEHTYSADWSSDAENHYHVCTVCGAKKDEATHTGGEATCVSKAECSICGAEYGETNSNNHKHVELENYEAATILTPGYTGDLVCQDCRTVVKKGEVIPRKGSGIIIPIDPGTPSYELPFVDVPEGEWYYESVYYAWDADLIDGTSATTFRPDNTLTVAEAIKLAAALHQLENDGAVTLKNGKTNWYDTYVAYAVKEGIIESKYQSYTQAQMNAPATRREFVHILHGALDEYEAMNAISDNAIPDVKTGDAYADEIYDFYRAGILTGSNAQGTFHPESSIKRSEVAAILIRMYDESMRLEKTL